VRLQIGSLTHPVRETSLLIPSYKKAHARPIGFPPASNRHSPNLCRIALAVSPKPSDQCGDRKRHAAIRKNILILEGTRWQYTHGVDPESVPPESYVLDTALPERPRNKDIQLDLFLDYASDVKLLLAFQDYFRNASRSLLKNTPSL